MVALNTNSQSVIVLEHSIKEVQTTKAEVGFTNVSCLFFQQGSIRDDQHQPSTSAASQDQRQPIELVYLGALLAENQAEAASVMHGPCMEDSQTAVPPGGRFINISPEEIDDIEALATSSFTNSTHSQTKWANKLFKGTFIVFVV